MEDCPACGYPLEVTKVIPGSIKAKKKQKVKCTANDCTYEGLVIPSEEEYHKVIERSDKEKQLLEKLKQKYNDK